MGEPARELADRLHLLGLAQLPLQLRAPPLGRDAFGDVPHGVEHVRPAATLVVVAGLITPSLLVEVEAEARRG